MAHRRCVPVTACRAHDASDRRRPGRAGRPQPAEDRTWPAWACGHHWSGSGQRQRAEAGNRGRNAPDRGRKRGQSLAWPLTRSRQRGTRTDSARPVPTEPVGGWGRVLDAAEAPSSGVGGKRPRQPEIRRQAASRGRMTPTKAETGRGACWFLSQREKNAGNAADRPSGVKTGAERHFGVKMGAWWGRGDSAARPPERGLASRRTGAGASSQCAGLGLVHCSGGSRGLSIPLVGLGKRSAPSRFLVLRAGTGELGGG